MKITSPIVEGGGWEGTRVDRIKIKASIALIIAIVSAIVSISASESIFNYIWIPGLISFIVSVFLFIREQPTKIESLSGKVDADPRKLYGNFGSNGVNPEQKNKAEQAASSNR
jgi:hypothetical protein